jgi:UDP-glucose 4-epimerase
MNILITGINGFIGKKLASSLLDEADCNVIGLSRTPAAFNQSNYEHIQSDIVSTSYHKIKTPIDAIIHLAQSKEYRDFPDKSEDIFNVNVRATFHLLEWAREKRISKFIFTSTGNVYTSKEYACKETDDTEPSSFYGRTKLMGEQLVKSYCSFFETYILRLFAIYGSGQKNMLIPNIIQSVKNNKAITLAMGKGIYINPVYIADLLLIFKKIIFSKTSLPQILNIGGDQTLSLDEIIKEIESQTNCKASIMETNGKPVFMIGDNTLLKSELSFSTFTNFSDGLSYLINES